MLFGISFICIIQGGNPALNCEYAAFSSNPRLVLNLDTQFFQTGFEAFEEVFDILRNDSSQ